MSDAILQRRIAELEQQLRESEQTVRALSSGEVDAVLSTESSTPVLLHAAQRKLRESEQLLRAVFEGAADAMLIADDQGRYVDANPAACLLFGLPKAALIGRQIADFIVPESLLEGQWQTFIGQGRMRAEFSLRRADGERRDLDGSAVAHVLPGLHLFILRDVSARKVAESELRASEVRYRRIVDNTSEGVWMYDAACSTTYVNPQLAGMLGRSVEEMIGRPIFEFMDEVECTAARSRLESGGPGLGEHAEVQLKRRDGSELWVAIHADSLSDAAGNFENALAFVTDISERRRADEMRSRLASIVASSGDAIISRGTDGVIRTWNRGAEKLTLYSAEEAVGKPIAMLYPQERAVELSATRQRVDDGDALVHFEMVVVRKDGSRVDVSLTSSVLTGDHGSVVGASIIARDITERRRAEAALRSSEEQLRQVQKMEGIGILAAGIAHDFNNLLSIILTYTTLIVEDLRPSDPLRAELEEVHKAGLRAAELTSQLLAFSRQQVLQPVVLDVNQVVSGLESMLSRLLREDIQLSVLASPLAGKVHADSGQLEQVIMNLVVNARDAMPSGGTITIETGNVVLDESYTVDHVGVRPGAHVMIAVTDTGTGMDLATKDKIFEPFFTTKETGKGTGLGLSTVFGIVQQSGGHIWVYSEVGRGTTFKVYLPRTDRVEEQQLALPAISTLRGTETILVVEDSEQVRTIICAVLSRNGYNVLEAQNAGDALLVCEQFGAEIPLLLTDVVMPRMSGVQLAERLVRVRPTMRVLYVSGYTDDTIVHHGVLAPGVDFLQKPIMPAALLTKVRQVLDSYLRNSGFPPNRN